MNGRWWETADRQVVAVNALEIVPVGQCSLVRVHRHRVEVPQVGDVVGGWVDHDRLAKRWSSVRSVLMSTRVCASGPVDGG
eukprot:g9173.t1